MDDTTALSAIHDLVTAQHPALEANTLESGGARFDTVAVPAESLAPAALVIDDAPADGHATEEMPAVTVEQTLFDQPIPVPRALHGEPAYLVEVRVVGRAPSLLAVRAALEDAFHIAASVHPGVGDVTIHELPLPCDAETLVRTYGRHRRWTRDERGTWEAC